MPLDDRLKADLATAAEGIDPAEGALDRARGLGHRRRRRRQAAIGATAGVLAGVVAVGGWIVLRDTGDDAGKVITAEPTPEAEDPAPDATQPTPAAGDGIGTPLERRVPAAPIFNRVDPVAAWTGDEVIIWGGIEDNIPTAEAVGAGVGAGLDAESATWRLIGLQDPGKSDVSAVWTGEEIAVWGGVGSCRLFDEVAECPDSRTDELRLLVGPSFDPTFGAQAPIAPRLNAEAVWTDDRMIVWGGFTDDGEPLRDGAIYDPVGDSWAVIPENPFGQAGSAITAFHNDSLVIGAGTGGVDRGWYRYSQDSGEWTQLPDPPVGIEDFAGGVQAGDRLVVFNGDTGDPLAKGTGAILDLATDTWVRLSGPPDRPQATDGVMLGDRVVFLGPERGRLLIYDLEIQNWSTWETGDETLFGARTLVQAGDGEVLAWNGTSGNGLIVDIAAMPVASSGSAEQAVERVCPSAADVSGADTVAEADYDGDGLLDRYVNLEGAGEAIVFGNGTATLPHAGGSVPEIAEYLGAVDLDGDGALELWLDDRGNTARTTTLYRLSGCALVPVADLDASTELQTQSFTLTHSVSGNAARFSTRSLRCDGGTVEAISSDPVVDDRNADGVIDDEDFTILMQPGAAPPVAYTWTRTTWTLGTDGMQLADRQEGEVTGPADAPVPLDNGFNC